MKMAKNRQIAIVTGASRGIGAAIPERVAADGLAVIVNYAGMSRRPRPASIERQEGAQFRSRPMSAMPKLFAAYSTRPRPHSAASMSWSTTLGSCCWRHSRTPVTHVFDGTVAIDLRGVFNGMREAAKRLRNGGRIISFSSSVVGLYQPTYGR